MAIVCYASTGSNTSPYETWAKAATSLATALAAATSGDTVQLDMANVASGDAELAGNITWEVPAGVTLHIGTQSGASGITTGTMGTTYWLGNSTVARVINFRWIAGGTGRIVGGLTVRNYNAMPTMFSAAASDVHADTVMMWNGGTGSAVAAIGLAEANIYIGSLTVRQDDTTPTAGTLNMQGRVEIGSLTLTYAGTISGLFDSTGADSDVLVHGGNISDIGSGSAICGDHTAGCANIVLHNVVLNASFAMLASQTNANKASVQLTLQDCSSSGSAVPFAYADACGEVRVDTGIYLTAGVYGRSAKITTTANCGPTNPFVTPWFKEYKAAATVNLSSEVLRDGSASAFTDAQFWKETLTKETSSSVLTTARTTRSTGTSIPAGVGTGSWTGESGTAWSGEITIDSVVLAEAGFVQQRFGAGVASSTIYADIGPVS